MAMPRDVRYRHQRTDLSYIPKFSGLHHTTKYSREKLKAMRLRGDVLADRVVAELHRTNGLTNIHDLFGTVAERAKTDNHGVFSQFLEDVRRVPSWVDKAAVERGQCVQAAYSIPMGASLFAGSLVGGAMFRSAALVTAMAGNLANEPARRTQETALIIAQLVFPGALLKEDGKSREALVRVRLLHAGLRHWLPASGRYTRKDELPINQHDLAITLSLFGYLNIRSLYLMNVHLTRREIDDYMAMWRYAGFLLGIEEEILPTSLEDQEEFFLASCVDEAHPSWIPEATKFVMDDVAQQINVNTHGMMPYHVAQTILHQLTKFLAGEEYCEGMKIENDAVAESRVTSVSRVLGGAYSFVVHYVPLGEPALRNWNIFTIRRGVAMHEAKSKQKLGARIHVSEDAVAKAQRVGNLAASAPPAVARL